MSSYCYLGESLECHISLSVQWCFLGNEIYQLGGWLFYTLGMFNIHTPRTSSTLNVNSRLHAVVDWSVADVLKLVTLTRPVTNTRCAKNSNIDKSVTNTQCAKNSNMTTSVTTLVLKIVALTKPVTNTRAKNSSIDKTNDKYSMC